MAERSRRGGRCGRKGEAEVIRELLLSRSVSCRYATLVWRFSTIDAVSLKEYTAGW